MIEVSFVMIVFRLVFFFSFFGSYKINKVKNWITKLKLFYRKEKLNAINLFVNILLK